MEAKMEILAGPVGRFGKVALWILDLAHGVAPAEHRILDDGQHALAHLGGGGLHCWTATAGIEVMVGQPAHRNAAEALHELNDHQRGMSRRVVRACVNGEGKLGFRPITGLCTVAPKGRNAIVDLRRTSQQTDLFSFFHKLHDLVLHFPRCMAVHDELLVGLDQGKFNLASRWKSYDQRECFQRHTRGFKQLVNEEKHALLIACVRQLIHTALMDKPRFLNAGAARFTEYLWPTRPLGQSATLGCSAVPAQKFDILQAGMIYKLE